MANKPYRDKKRMVGNKVSHSNMKTKTVRKPNLQPFSIFVPEENKVVKVRVSARCGRSISKIGLYQYIKKEGLSFRQFGLNGPKS